MNKIAKSLIAVLLLSSMTASIAQAYPTANDIVDCGKLRDRAGQHHSWSKALRELNSDIHSFTETQAYRTAKQFIKEFYLNLEAVRDTAGISDESDGLVTTKKLMEKVYAKTILEKKATELMMEKLQELDEETDKTIRQAENEIYGCRLRARKLQDTSDESSPEALQ